MASNGRIRQIELSVLLVETNPRTRELNKIGFSYIEACPLSGIITNDACLILEAI